MSLLQPSPRCEPGEFPVVRSGTFHPNPWTTFPFVALPLNQPQAPPYTTIAFPSAGVPVFDRAMPGSTMVQNGQAPGGPEQERCIGTKSGSVVSGAL